MMMPCNLDMPLNLQLYIVTTIFRRPSFLLSTSEDRIEWREREKCVQLINFNTAKVGYIHESALSIRTVLNPKGRKLFWISVGLRFYTMTWVCKTPLKGGDTGQVVFFLE